jgi:DNA (cytosine-5)-methyltransferase 1
MPLATIMSTIVNIPEDVVGHDIPGLRFCANATKRPFDAHSAAKTIICGEHNYEPSGGRRYTNREFASLQTFPLDFQFHKGNTKEQIGNAVPPKLAQLIYQGIVELAHAMEGQEYCLWTQTGDNLRLRGVLVFKKDALVGFARPGGWFKSGIRTRV